ncbi:MAG: hypothetical protein LBG15_04860 [Dysgonamonadaceae bacterium]|jgi:hypothetical protein|nr:hypothetical protein [Dysgonamonadaceae bacterium]
MSVTVRKTSTGEIFNLPADYVIEAEKNNPLFENKGSQTVPIAFPATGKNNRLLNFPFRLDKTHRQEETLEVLVETGSVQQRGLLSVNSASKQTISANIGYDESEMYAQFENMQLRNISNLPVLSFGGNNTDEKVNSILSHLTAVMKQQVETEYYLFPVVLSHEVTETETDGVKEFKSYDEIINEVDTSLDADHLPYGKIAELKALSNRTITRYEENEEIQLTVPKGYGVSPFLKVYRILELVFEHFGFSVTENPFKDHRQLKKLVVLNNNMDAILSGTLYYKDLMPDITIKEFLDTLYSKFGMLYFIESNSKTVQLKFLKDIVKSGISEQVNLNSCKTEEPSIAFSSPKQLKLKMNREIESAKVLYDTYEEFLEKFLYWFSEAAQWKENATQVFRTTESKYLIINIFDSESEPLISSDFFDWDKKTPGISYEEIEMKDLCVPLDTYSNTAFRLLYYLVNYKHLYSDVVVNGETQENIENPAKPAFVFAWGLTSRAGNTDFNYFFASQFNRDENGCFMNDENGDKYDISLTCNREDGLFNRFWKEYDAFIRHSNQEVKCNLKLREPEIFYLKMYETVFINNQPLLLKQIKYKLNKRGSISECIFRTLHLYKPYDLTLEQQIPAYERQKYYWAFERTEMPKPDFAFLLKVEYDNFYTVNGIQVPISNISFLPPTEEQYQSGEQRIFKYRTIYHTAPFETVTIQTTVVYRPEFINYES